MSRSSALFPILWNKPKALYALSHLPLETGLLNFKAFCKSSNAQALVSFFAVVEISLGAFAWIITSNTFRKEIETFAVSCVTEKRQSSDYMPILHRPNTLYNDEQYTCSCTTERNPAHVIMYGQKSSFWNRRHRTDKSCGRASFYALYKRMIQTDKRTNVWCKKRKMHRTPPWSASVVDLFWINKFSSIYLAYKFETLVFLWDAFYFWRKGNV